MQWHVWLILKIIISTGFLIFHYMDKDKYIRFDLDIDYYTGYIIAFKLEICQDCSLIF